MPFMFENLFVYQKSLEWVELSQNICDSIKLTCPAVAIDQLSRASLSIPLNIAEGNGRWHKGDKRQFFWIARGSIFECVSLIQILRKTKKIDEEAYLKSYDNLEQLTKMLTKLISSVGNVTKGENEAS